MACPSAEEKAERKDRDLPGTGCEYYMRLALEEARKAYDLGEIPIGSVIVRDGEVIAKAFNSTEQDKDPTCHAKVKAIKEAVRVLKGCKGKRKG